jgi:hypothetical protein
LAKFGFCDFAAEVPWIFVAIEAASFKHSTTSAFFCDFAAEILWTFVAIGLISWKTQKLQPLTRFAFCDFAAGNLSISVAFP